MEATSRYLKLRCAYVFDTKSICQKNIGHIIHIFLMSATSVGADLTSDATHYNINVGSLCWISPQ